MAGLKWLAWAGLIGMGWQASAWPGLAWLAPLGWPGRHQENPGSTRRTQDDPEGPRRTQEDPGESRDDPGEHKKTQEDAAFRQTSLTQALRSPNLPPAFTNSNTPFPHPSIVLGAHCTLPKNAAMLVQAFKFHLWVPS